MTIRTPNRRTEPRWEIYRLGNTDGGFSAASGSSEILVPLCQVLIPKGTLLAGREIEVHCGGTKSAGVETFTPRFRLGPLGTVADAQLNGAPSIGATTRSFDGGMRWKVRTATTIQRIGMTGGFNKESNSGTSVEQAADTVSDMTTTDLYFSMTVQQSGTAEWIKVQHFKVVISG